MLLAQTWFREEDPARSTSFAAGSARPDRAVGDWSSEAATQPLLQAPARGQPAPPRPPIGGRDVGGGALTSRPIRSLSQGAL